MLLTWQEPGGSEEYALGFGPNDGPKILMLPAWFDESNKLRHFTIEVMRALADHGLASVLPDLPGCNESREPLEAQSMASWTVAAREAAETLDCSHVLAIRAGANIAPDLPGWAYAPLAGKTALRGLLRARVISSKEAGREEKREDLIELGMAEGLELAGHRLGSKMISQLVYAELPVETQLAEIKQTELGGAGLWLRMEPDHDEAQSAALAARIARDLRQ